MKARWAGGLGLLGLLVAGSQSSCIYDSADRCSPGERVDRYGYCVCKDGYVSKYAKLVILTSDPAGPVLRDGCVPCGEHEVVQNDQCACDTGYAKSDATGKCEQTMAASVDYGHACSADGDCTGTGAKCITDDVIGAATTPRAGYCSSSCTSVTDCPGDKGYGCHPGTSGSFCRLPLTGEGDSCDFSKNDPKTQENPACTGEASVCAITVCAAPELCSGDASCAPGYTCCDLTSLGGAPICMPPSACPIK